MSYENHGRRKFSNQLFNLYSRINVNLVKSFIPPIQMCWLLAINTFFLRPVEKTLSFFKLDGRDRHYLLDHLK